MYFVSTHENRRVKPIEIVRRERRKEEKQWRG
jgi:hypothetical protein